MTGRGGAGPAGGRGRMAPSVPRPALSLGRRSALAGAAGALLGGAAPGAEAEALRRQLAGLRLGANLERWYPIARDNRARRLGPAWWRDFRAAGFDHARLFLPDVAQTGDSPEILRQFAEAVADANAAGLPVLLGLADAYHHGRPWDGRAWAAFATRAGHFAARTDPARVVLAPLNEPAFPDAATWQPVRDRLLAALRQAAPRHLLMWGGHEWCSWRSLLAATPPADPATVAEVHDYEAGDADAVRQRFGRVAAWRDRHGLPVLVSELGGAHAHRTDPAALAGDLRASLPVLRALGLPVALWAITHGGWWRLQAGDSPQPRPELRGALAG